MPVDLSSLSTAVGDYNAYSQKGAELYTQGKAALAGNPDAQASLLSAGITLARTAAGGDPTAGIILNAIGGAASGFAMGGPVGAVVGLGESLIASLAGGDATDVDYFYMSTAELAILNRMQAWDRAVQAQGITSDPFGRPIGWRLYDYIARVTPPNYQPSYCTPYLWKLSSELPNCNREIASFQTWPGTPDQLKALLVNAVENNDPNLANQIIARAPPPNFYQVELRHDKEPPAIIFRHFSAPPVTMVLGAYYLLSLGTVFGMLQANIHDESIVSELMVQRHLWLLENQGNVDTSKAQLAATAAQLGGDWQPTWWNYRIESSRAHTLDMVNRLIDFFVARAQANHPAVNPLAAALQGMLGGSLGAGHAQTVVNTPPPRPPIIINPSALGDLSAVARAQWVKHYLSLGKKA